MDPGGKRGLAGWSGSLAGCLIGQAGTSSELRCSVRDDVYKREHIRIHGNRTRLNVPGDDMQHYVVKLNSNCIAPSLACFQHGVPVSTMCS